MQPACLIPPSVDHTRLFSAYIKIPSCTLDINHDDCCHIIMNCIDERSNHQSGRLYWHCFARMNQHRTPRAADDGNGLQAWQALLRASTLRNPMSLTNQLLDPHFSSRDPRVHVRHWKRTQMSTKQKQVRGSQSRPGKVSILTR